MLTGANTYAGATGVTGGTLLVNGSIASAVTVGNAGRLGGTGTIAGATVSGTIAPGTTGIGTLRVAGPLTVAATGILEVDAAPGGTADLLAVTGAVTLNGGGVAVRTGGATGFQPLTTYTILTGGSVTGTFSSVTADAAFLNPALTYDATSVRLRLVRNDVSFAAIGQTANQRAVGAALQPQGAGAAFDAVVVLSAADARAGFDQLSGEVHAATAAVARREGHDNGRAVLGRFDVAGGDGPHLWLEGAGGHADVDGRDGFASIESGRYAVAGGFELAGHGNRGGVGFRHAHAGVDLAARASSGTLTLDSVFAYAGHDFGALRFALVGSLGWLSADTDRRVAISGFTDRDRLREKGQSFTGAGEIAYLPTLGGVRVGPYAGISYVDTVLRGGTETGGGAALAIEKVEDTTGQASLGVRGTGALGAIRVTADLGGRSWLDQPSAPRALRFRGFDQMFVVSPAELGRTFATARLDASADVGGVTLGLGVGGEANRSTTSYAGRLSAAFRF